MTPNPPNAGLSMRLGARIGPETLAAILSVGVIGIVAVIVLAAGGSGPGSAAVPQPTGSPASSAPVATPSPAPSPTQSPAPDVATARVVLQIVDELLAARTGLAEAVSPREPSAEAIAERLRAINAGLITLEQPLAELGRGSASAIADRILAVSDATHAAVTDTQRASVTNVAAYKRGGGHVVDVMEPLVEIRAELAAIAGGSPAASTAPGSVSPGQTQPGSPAP